MRAFKGAYKRSGKFAAIGSILSASNPDPFTPTTDTDVSVATTGIVHTSNWIDDFLIYHAFTLATSNITQTATPYFIKIKGNGNPTSKSNAARQWLYDNAVPIDTNADFVELI